MATRKINQNYGLGPSSYTQAPNGFNMGGMPTPQMFTPPPPVEIPQVDIFNPPTMNRQAIEDQRLKQLYTPETSATNAFDEAIRNQPQYHDPGFFGKLGASLTGLARGPEAAQQQLYAPYNRELAEWKVGMEPKYQAANLERQANQGQLTLAREVMRGEDADRKQDEINRSNRAKEETARMRAESQGMVDRANAAKNNGYTVQKAGGRFVGIDPQGHRIDIGPSGGLDRETELNILGEWGVKRAEAQGEAAVRTAQAGATANNRDLVIGDDGRTYARQPDGRFIAVPGAPQGADKLGTERSTGGVGSKDFNERLNNTMRILHDTDDAGMKYLVPPATVNGNWSFKPPTSSIFKSKKQEEEEKAEYDALRQRVYGGGEPQQQQQQQQPQGATAPTQSTPAPIAGSRNQTNILSTVPPIAGSNVVPPSQDKRDITTHYMPPSSSVAPGKTNADFVPPSQRYNGPPASATSGIHLGAPGTGPHAITSEGLRTKKGGVDKWPWVAAKETEAKKADLRAKAIQILLQQHQPTGEDQINYLISQGLVK